MISGLLITLGIIGAIMSLLDFLLDDTQKKTLLTRVMGVWNRLDDAKNIHLPSMLRNTKSRALAVILASIFVGSYYALIAFSIDSDLKEHYGVTHQDVSLMLKVAFLCTLALGSYIGERLLKNIVYNRRPAATIMSILVILGLSIASFFVGIGDSRELLRASDGLLSPIDYVFLAYGFACNFVWIAVSMVFLVFAVPLLMLNVSKLFVCTVELFFRRAIEYPKGPLVATSLGLAALGGYLKSAFGV